MSISIITATFNSASTLKGCLESVESQEVEAEQIIIDGGSNDDTISIAKSYPKISTIISQPDRGVYDAMNKGIGFAKGNIIGILNSDDYYATRHVLSHVVSVFKNEAIDSCYGDLVYVDQHDTNRIKRTWTSGPFDRRKFLWGWMPPHPTFFVRRSVYKKFGKFNLNLGSAADYELMLRLLFRYNISTIYIPEVLVNMRSGGLSNASFKHRFMANRLDRKAWEINGLNPFPWTLYVKPLRKIWQFIQPHFKSRKFSRQ